MRHTDEDGLFEREQMVLLAILRRGAAERACRIDNRDACPLNHAAVTVPAIAPRVWMETAVAMQMRREQRGRALCGVRMSWMFELRQ
jgi:hypothetical protein